MNILSQTVVVVANLLFFSLVVGYQARMPSSACIFIGVWTGTRLRKALKKKTNWGGRAVISRNS